LCCIIVSIRNFTRSDVPIGVFAHFSNKMA